MNNFLNKQFVVPLLCFFSGSICALGMAPYNIWPVFFIGFGVLYWAIYNARNKRIAFGYGWIWAFGYFVFSLYWIGNALLVEGNPYGWAWPLAVCGLPALLAFFNAFACLAVKRFCDLSRWHGYLGFVSALSLFEYLRGHMFTGFPWNLYGYTWIDMPPIAQLASLESVYFLTFLTVFWLSCGGFFIVATSSLFKRVISSAVLLSFFGGFYFGAGLIGSHAFNDDITVKIVQPNTEQAEKWQRDKMDGHFMNALELSKATPEDEALKTIIVWPETTLSPAFLNAPYYRQQIAETLSAYQGEAVLMTGALRYEADSKTYYNSLLTIDAGGAISRVYDKAHLVPFGEYIPFQDWIPLAPVTQFQGFVAGNGVQTMELFEGLHYSPLICYEVIFPKNVIPKSDKPDFIVNVTNDAWYGDSAGPRQHLVKTQFRAIEEGIPVLRAANTGISAIIDKNGRKIQHSDTFTQEVLISNLPINSRLKSDNLFLMALLFPIIPLIFFIFNVANTYTRIHED